MQVHTNDLPMLSLSQWYAPTHHTDCSSDPKKSIPDALTKTRIRPPGGRNCQAMRRMNFYGRIVFAVVAITVASTSATAGWWHEFWHNSHVGYDRNNAWPDPFNDLDARSVIMPFEIQKRNGWRTQNTIGSLMFRESDGALVSSGHEKIYQIATQAPPSRREIYVLRGRTERETNARVDSVRQSLARMNLRQGTPAIAIIDRPPYTMSGARAVKNNRDAMENMPKPRLPSSSAAGTASATQ